MTYKEEFIKFMYDCGVLTFGEFTLKSGRLAPYFINVGNYNTGSQLARLGDFYAQCINENNISVETLFGPAYKGIPLSIATAVSLFKLYNIDANYAFDRKEAKDHGEGGLIVGKQLVDNEKIVIIEDVMTSGKALREVLPKIKSCADVDITAMIIQVDRMEKGLTSDLSAVQEVKRDFDINVFAIVNINDIIEAIRNNVIPGAEHLSAMMEYRSKYGVN